MLYVSSRAYNKAGSGVQGAEAVYITMWIILYISTQNYVLFLDLRLLLSCRFGFETRGVEFRKKTLKSSLRTKHSIDLSISETITASIYRIENTMVNVKVKVKIKVKVKVLV